MPKLNETKLGHEIGKSPPKGKYIWSACDSCGIPRWVVFVKYTNAPKNSLCLRCGTKKAMIKRGKNKQCKQKKKGGYICVHLSDKSSFFPMATKRGWVRQHRLVVAKHLGRNLDKSEIVHHLNGNKKDNRIENLSLLSISSHSKVHKGIPFIRRIQDLERSVKCLEARIRILDSQIESFQENYIGFSERNEAL